MSWRLRTWRGKAYEVIESLAASPVSPGNQVVVSGFWRTGTTWLQEILAQALSARTVFEPFAAFNQPFLAYTSELRLPRRDTPFINGLFPYPGKTLAENPRLAALVSRALGGGWYGIWNPLAPDYCDRTLAGSLRRRVVTKFVRANLCIGAIQSAFGVPVIHIQRDPRAVVASLVHPDPHWGGGTFVDFPLRAHLLEVEDGREEIFARWRSEIEEIDRMPNTARLAAYYCMTEAFAERSLASSRGQTVIVDYASLLRDGFAPVFEFLLSSGFTPDPGGVDTALPSVFDKRSWLSGTPASVEARLNGWREVLTLEEARVIADIAARFGLAGRCAG